MTEPISSLFFDANAIREAPRKLYRVDSSVGRLYSVLEPKPLVFPSVTTVIHATRPTAKFLMDWIASHGRQRAERMKDESAAYGTLMHIVLADFLISRSVTIAQLGEAIEAFKGKKDYDTSRWAERLAEDVVGFAVFARKYQLKPLGIEIPLASEKLGYAGTLDLVCKATFGRTKLMPTGEYTTYLDWKSSRKAFYPEGAIQCGAYGPLWNEQFPSLPIERMLLYGAKDWDEGSEAPYRMQEVTAHPLVNLFPALLAIYNVENPGIGSSKSPRIKGVISLDEDPFEVNVTYRNGLEILQGEAA